MQPRQIGNRNNYPECKYTQLLEPIETIMKKLVESNLITLLNFENYQEPQEKPSWYNECDLCDFHKIKGHKTTNCMKLKNIIQDLIEKDTIFVEVPTRN